MHFKVEEDLEQTIIEKKMIRSASKWLTLKLGWLEWYLHLSTKKKITLSNIHLAIRREPPFCCRSGPHQCPVVAPNYADCRSCRYGILVSSSVHLASWALWASYITGWCQRIRQGPWALGMHHAIEWLSTSKWRKLPIDPLDLPNSQPRTPGQFQSRSLTTHKPPAGMFKQRLGISSSQM